MFEEARLLGPTERSIALQTRGGTDLSNVIEPEPTPQQHRQYRDLFQKHGGNWVERKPATGGYNCAGHVWASRRTSLTDPAQWRLILREDGYRPLPEAEEPVSDDLVVYVNQADDEIIHVARIVELRQGVAPGAARIPWMVSRWGPVAGEAMHFRDDVPYHRLGFSLRIEYWTDR